MCELLGQLTICDCTKYKFDERFKQMEALKDTYHSSSLHLCVCFFDAVVILYCGMRRQRTQEVGRLWYSLCGEKVSERWRNGNTFFALILS